MCSDYDPIFGILVKKSEQWGMLKNAKGTTLGKFHFQTKLPLFCSHFCLFALCANLGKPKLLKLPQNSY